MPPVANSVLFLFTTVPKKVTQSLLQLRCVAMMDTHLLFIHQTFGIRTKTRPHVCWLKQVVVCLPTMINTNKQV